LVRHGERILAEATSALCTILHPRTASAPSDPWRAAAAESKGTNDGELDHLADLCVMNCRPLTGHRADREAKAACLPPTAAYRSFDRRAHRHHLPNQGVDRIPSGDLGVTQQRLSELHAPGALPKRRTVARVWPKHWWFVRRER
jgi:hypothetical protein